MESLIKDQIMNFMEKPNGLSIVEVPTGRGKTYTVLQSIVEYRKKDPDRCIFFVTTQKKNLPYDDLRKAYNDDKKFDEEVIELRPVIDAFLAPKNTGLKEAENTCKKWTEYIQLLSLVQQKKGLINKEYTLSQKEEDKLNEDLSLAEYQFRCHLSSFLENEINEDPSIKSHLDSIKNARYRKYVNKKYITKLINEKYDWVRKLYPAMDSDLKKVFLLSMHKFVYGNQTIVEPPYKFVNCDLTQNAIVFIDEFDSTKGVIDDIIIDKIADNYLNKINLFNKIRLRFNTHFPKIYMITCNAKNVRVTFEEMKKRTEELYNELFAYSSLKLIKEDQSTKSNLMFYDGIIHTIGNPQKKYIVAVRNNETEQLDIKFLSKKEHDDLDKDSFVYVSAILENIDNYFDSFRRFIKRWAQEYSSYKKITEENSVSSILYHFGVTDDEEPLLMESNLYYMPYDKELKKTIYDIMPELTYYNHGFDIHMYIDSERHNEDTEIRTLQKHETPEKFMNNLCLHSNVIGVSATALLPTYDNYCLPYLEDSLFDSYTIINDDVLSKIQEKEENLLKEYEDKGIKIHTNILQSGSELGKIKKKDDKTFGVLSSFLDECEARVLANVIEGATGKKNHLIVRYLDVIKAMYDFWTDDNAHAWLFLSWPLLKENNNDFNKDVIKSALEKIISSTGKNPKNGESINDFIVVLQSGDEFELKKKNLSEDLSLGKKRMVFSSYQTLMAGQNLNFKYIPKNLKNYVTIGKKDSSDSRYRTTDYDGIVLGKISHQNLWKSFKDKTWKENVREKLDLTSRIQLAYEGDYINKSEQEDLLNYVISDENISDKTALVAKINNSPIFRNKILQIIMQAIGRITRTFVKNKNIKIYINQSVLGTIDKDEFKKHILTPELQSIYNICPGVEPCNVDRYTERAIKNSSRGNILIHRILYNEDGIWSQEEMDIWEKLRKEVLCNPTSDKERVFRYIYFKTDNNASSYFYSQIGDFSAVKIDFRCTSRDEFINKYNLRDFVEDNSLIVSTVSEESCRLKEILSCPGMEQYFIENGYATHFEPKPFIITPVIFQNIYKGALGEVSGKFIFEKYFKIKLKKITDPSKYELFDYEIKEGIYVDFKHWRPYFYIDRNKSIAKILRKLKECGGKKVYIVNIFADKNFMPQEISDDRIVLIRNLIDENNGNVNYEAMKCISEINYIGDNKIED